MAATVTFAMIEKLLGGPCRDVTRRISLLKIVQWRRAEVGE
jgi:hypothetical protein